MKHDPDPPVGRRDDMAKFRASLKNYCSSCKSGDFDTVNFITTLRRTVSELSSIFDAYMGDVRLSPGRMNVLMTLDAQPTHRMPLSELGDYLVVTRANITGLIDGLVKDGLVRRIDHPDDRRMVLAELTDKGKRFIEWFEPLRQSMVKSVGECISDEQKKIVVDALDQLREHIRARPIPKLEPFPE